MESENLLPHTDFDGAFTSGTVFLKGEQEFQMETARRGTLVVPSGRIVANDALAVLWRARPFERDIPPGKYPVSIAWNGSETCAMRVQFSRRKTARWEPAIRTGEKLTSTSEAHPPCFGVDSGMAAFFDAEAARLAGDDQSWSERFDDSQHSMEIDHDSGANMVWCFSGYGDGGYPCYWGLDRKGEVACLVADFLVLVEGVYEEHVVTQLHEKIGEEWSDPWFEQSGCTGVRLTWHSKKRKEVQFAYRCSNPLEVQLINSRGKETYWTTSGGGGENPWYMRTSLDLNKDKKTKLIIKRDMGMRSLPRKS